MMSMVGEKAPGNYLFTKEFYIWFWQELKERPVASIRAAKCKMEFSLSQRQAVIKLIQNRSR